MKRYMVVLAAGVLAAAVVMLLTWNPYFNLFNSIAYDFTLRVAGPVAPASPTVIVSIDEESLSRVGSWPWSRSKLATIINEINKGNPRSIAIDMILDESRDPASDADLAQAIARSRSVVLGARVSDNHETWLKPQPLFIQPSVRLGHVHADPDLVGADRTVYSSKVAGGTVLPAFSVEALRGAGIEIDPSFEDIQPGVTVFRPQPFNIRFVGPPGSFPEIPAWKVLGGEVPPDTFKDRIVLIGETAEGLGGDQWFTPFSESGRKMSGVEIHANAIDTLYAHRWIHEVSGMVFFACLVVLVLFLWWLDQRFEGVRFYFMAILLAPVMLGISAALMKYWNTWLAFPPFFLTIGLGVPGLEVQKLMRVNKDLDSQIEKLSRWGVSSNMAPSPGVEERVAFSLPPGPQRTAWLQALKEFEQDSARRSANRKRLLSVPWQNARWRLDAVDFFNEELVRFLSFNTTILSSIQDVTIVSDVSGRVVYQNPAAQGLENYRDDAAFAPDYFAALLDGRDFTAAFAEVFSGQKTVMMEFVPAHNGKQFFHLAMAPFAQVGLVLSLHDATAQYELNLAKNEMISLVSHELRTPLTAIRGYSDMLLKYDLVHEKGREFLGTILEESQRLTQLIQSFLDIAYIESGRQKVSKTEFEIDPMFRDMLAVLDPIASGKNIRLLAVPSNGMIVAADRLLLYQALSNLITNAIKYSPEGTEVRIAVTNGNGRVAFRVADQGCGIPGEDAAKIFEKFYRRGNKETQEQSGFGLGLAFVKEVAVHHGGEVTVESSNGEGSTFTLSIPGASMA